MSSHLSSRAPCDNIGGSHKTTTDVHDVTRTINSLEPTEGTSETTQPMEPTSPALTDVTRTTVPAADSSNVTLLEEQGTAEGTMSSPAQTKEGDRMDEVTMPIENIPPAETDATRAAVPVIGPAGGAVLGEREISEVTMPKQPILSVETAVTTSTEQVTDPTDVSILRGEGTAEAVVSSPVQMVGGRFCGMGNLALNSEFSTL